MCPSDVSFLLRTCFVTAMAFCSSEISKFNLSQILSISEKDNKGMVPKSEIGFVASTF